MHLSSSLGKTMNVPAKAQGKFPPSRSLHCDKTIIWRTNIAKVSTSHFVSCKFYQPGSFGEELLQEKASLVGEIGSNIHPAWFYICWHHIHYPQA
ncbi:unnamed protein product [Gadus morhua 'NCC']